MKPVLAAAICLMLGSSSFSFPAGSVQPVRPIAIRQAVLGHPVPVLTGRSATLALVIAK